MKYIHVVYLFSTTPQTKGVIDLPIPENELALPVL